MPYTRFLKISSVPDGIKFIAASIFSWLAVCDLHFIQASFHFVFTGLNFGFHIFDQSLLWPPSALERLPSFLGWPSWQYPPVSILS
jgi:hypothetical protein